MSDRIESIIYLSILVISALIGLINFKTISNTFKLLTLLLILTFISETISTVLQNTKDNNSLPEKIYTPIHIAFFTGIYYTLINNSTYKKIIASCGTILFTISVIIISRLIDAELPAKVIMADSIMLVFFSILYFYELVTNPNENSLLLSGSFWLNTSVIIYFTGTFIFWASFNYLLHHHKNILMHISWVFNNFFDNFHYLLLGIALFLHVKNKN